VNDLVKEAALLWERQPQLQRMVVKLNEGFSGEGNGLLDLASLSPQLSLNPSLDERMDRLQSHLPNLAFESATESWTHYSSRIPILGAIVESYIEGKPKGDKTSPSFQGAILPGGRVEALSTHDQILGGPNQQIYLGCRFPAYEGYRLQLQELGLKVGQNLLSKGVLERFGVDFVAVESENGMDWEVQAIEINLRKGGTTHPFMTLKLLTNGHYDVSTGLFSGQKGIPKYYVASDNLQKNAYYGLLPNDLMDIIAEHHLHFDSGNETGTVFHLVGCLSEFGKVGLTSIGNSPEEADQIYRHVAEVLDQETKPREVAQQTMPIAWCLGQD
jgi:PGM1 C-terminal domain